MNIFSRFIRPTLLGGVLFLMPIVLLAVLLNKAFDFARRGLKPLVKLIPDQLISGARTETILAIVLLVLICFLAGLFARTALAQRFMTGLESLVLSKIPAYDYLKQAGSSMMGLGEMADRPAVLAQLDDNVWQIGVQTGVAAEGLAVIFIPNSPNTLSGGLFFVALDRVRPLKAPVAEALHCIERCGTGAGSLLAELKFSGVAT
jgi:uncharacterized membrane protein